MLIDRYGLPLSTMSTAARDDYVLATDRALTFYPGAAEAYDRAIAAEPGFALAHAGKAQVRMRQGDIAAAQAALAAAKDASAGARGKPHRVFRSCIRGPNRGGNRGLVPASRGVAA
jgi:hypothetical protein